MEQSRTAGGPRHLVRAVIISAGFGLLILGSIGPPPSFLAPIALLVLGVGNIATMSHAQLKRPAKTWEMILLPLLAGGMIASLIWARRQGADDWLKAELAFLTHPAFLTLVWAVVVGTELLSWRRSRKAPVDGATPSA